MANKVEKSYLISAAVFGYFLLISIGNYLFDDQNYEECDIGYTSGSVCVRFCCDHYENCTDTKIDQSFNLSMLNLADTFDNKVNSFKKSRHEPHCNGLSLHPVEVDVKWVFGYRAAKFRIKLESNSKNLILHLDHYCFKDKPDKKRNLQWQLQVCNENDILDHFSKVKFIIDIVNIIILTVIVVCLALAQRSQSSVHEKCIIGLTASILLTRVALMLKTLNVIAEFTELTIVFWLFTLNFEVWFCFRNLHKTIDNQQRFLKYLALIFIPNAVSLALEVNHFYNFFFTFIFTMFLMNIVLMIWNSITVWINSADADEGSKFALIRKQFWIGFAWNLMIHTTWMIELSDFTFFRSHDDMKASIYHISFMLPSIASLYTSIIMLIMCGRIGDHIRRFTRFEPDVILFKNEEEESST